MAKQYKSLRTGKILNLTDEGADLFNKRGMAVVSTGETFQDDTATLPKTSGGRTKPKPESNEGEINVMGENPNI